MQLQLQLQVQQPSLSLITLPQNANKITHPPPPILDPHITPCNLFPTHAKIKHKHPSSFPYHTTSHNQMQQQNPQGLHVQSPPCLPLWPIGMERRGRLARPPPPHSRVPRGPQSAAQHRILAHPRHLELPLLQQPHRPIRSPSPRLA